MNILTIMEYFDISIYQLTEDLRFMYLNNIDYEIIKNLSKSDTISDTIFQMHTFEHRKSNIYYVIDSLLRNIRLSINKKIM